MSLATVFTDISGNHNAEESDHRESSAIWAEVGNREAGSVSRLEWIRQIIFLSSNTRASAMNCDLLPIITRAARTCCVWCDAPCGAGRHRHPFRLLRRNVFLVPKLWLGNQLVRQVPVVSARALGSVVALVCLLSGVTGANEADGQGVAFFEKRIRPVLVARCYKCHSAEAKEVKGELHCSHCSSQIYPGLWTDEIDRVYLYNLKRIGNPETYTRFKPLAIIILIAIVVVAAAAAFAIYRLKMAA